MPLTSKESKIVERVRLLPGETELQIARALFGPRAVPQTVNGEIRGLITTGDIRRDETARPFRYYPGDGAQPLLVAAHAVTTALPEGALSEDEIKEVLRARLASDGWSSVVKMGHERGIDIEAHRGSERWVIEVKGPGSLQTMRVNYFLAILGETLQRMDNAEARYSIALPDLQQFRRLWDRLPRLAKERTKIDAIFVSMDGSLEIVS